jgi:hypothetical protein
MSLYPRERNPGTYRVGAWVGPWVSVHAVAKRKISRLRRQLNAGSPDRRPDCILPTLFRPLFMDVFIFPNSKVIILSGLFNNPANFPPTAQQPIGVQGLLISGASRSHSYSPSVGLLWTNDQPVAETSTWQHTTLTTDRHPRPRRDSNPQSQHASGRRPTS